MSRLRTKAPSPRGAVLGHTACLSALPREAICWAPSTGTFSACALLRTSVMEHKGSFHLSLCPRAKEDTFFQLFRDDVWKENGFKIPQDQPEVLGWIVSPKVPVPGEPYVVYARVIT